MRNNALKKASNIKLLILDVDGVLTDGKLFFGPDGETLKVFHVLDGHGIRLLEQYGIQTAIISARKSAMVMRRAEDLGIKHIQLGVQNKLIAFSDLLSKTGFDAAECAYIGDDVIDLPILIRVGFSASVPNGHVEVRSRVDYVTNSFGGNGAVREICDLILQSQEKYGQMMESYLK